MWFSLYGPRSSSYVGFRLQFYISLLNVDYKFCVDSRFPVGSCSLNNRLGLPRWHQWLKTKTKPTCHCRRHERRGFDPWVGKIPWRRKWQSTPGFLPGKTHRQRPGGLQSIESQRVGQDWACMQEYCEKKKLPWTFLFQSLYDYILTYLG